MLHREHIQQRTAEQVAQILREWFAAYCTVPQQS
jgi:hypothetical protein